MSYRGLLSQMVAINNSCNTTKIVTVITATHKAKIPSFFQESFFLSSLAFLSGTIALQYISVMNCRH